MDGLGVLIKQLGSKPASVEAYKASLDKKIKNVKLDPEGGVDGNGAVVFLFDDGSKLEVVDALQLCCETRYMTTDDDLSVYEGAKFLGMEIKTGPEVEDEYGELHEIVFLDVKTSRGVFQMATHNEHNGYYGGFYIQCRLVK